MFIKYLPCSRHLDKLVTCIISFKPLKTSSGKLNIICILLMKKLGLRECDFFAKDHPVRMIYTIPCKIFGFGADRNLINCTSLIEI